MYKQNQSKGSTLLLAMIVISTVLFAGIGVGTILSRQIRDIRTLEDSAAAFYARETGVDAGDATESWKDLDWDGVEPKSAYREKNGNIEGKSGSVRWAMGDPLKVNGPGDPDRITIYYDNGGNWNGVNFEYQFDGSEYMGEHSMEPSSDHSGWYEIEIDVFEKNTIDAFFKKVGFGGESGDGNVYSWDIQDKGSEVHVYYNTGVVNSGPPPN